METALRKAWLADGIGGMFPTELPGSIPADQSGLRLGRVRVLMAATRPDERLIDVAGPIVQARVREQFVSVPEGELAAAALTCRVARSR
jgi:hypothetical protein